MLFNLTFFSRVTLIFVLVFTIAQPVAEEHPTDSQIKPSDTLIQQLKLYSNTNSDSEWKELSPQQNTSSQTRSTTQNQQSSGDSVYHQDPSQIEQRQRELKELQLNQQAKQLIFGKESQWIRKQRQDSQVSTGLVNMEEFHFVIEDSTNKTFIIDLRNKVDDDGILILQIKVFVEIDGAYNRPIRPAQSTYLRLRVGTTSKQVMPLVDKKIYMFSRLQLEHRPLFYLNFENSYDRRIYTMVRVERMLTRVNPPAQQSLDPMSAKLVSIVEKFRDPVGSMKWLEDYRNTQLGHSETYLKLALLQIVLIVVTVVVQASFIRKLIDSKTIV